MVYSHSLADRIRAVGAREQLTEKKMFGCLCFFISGKMLLGVWKNAMIARVGPDAYEGALQQEHVREFDANGKPMRNWVLIEPEGLERDDQLEQWLERAAEFVRTLP